MNLIKLLKRPIRREDDADESAEGTMSPNTTIVRPRNPMDALKIAGKGFVSGVAQTGSLAGGIGGAAVGAAQSVLRPRPPAINDAESRTIPIPPVSPERAESLSMLNLPRAKHPAAYADRYSEYSEPKKLSEVFPSGTPEPSDVAKEGVLPVRPRRPSADKYDEIVTLENTPAKNTDVGFKAKAADVLKNAGRGFLRGFAQTGSLMGGVGGAAFGAGHQVVDSSLDEKRGREEKLTKLYGEYDKMTKAEEVASKQRKANLENQSATVKLNQDSLDLMRSENKELFDSITADDVVTEEEAALANKKGFLMHPYDARKFETIERNGQTLTTPSKGVPDYRPTNAPVEQSKVPVERALADGTEVFTTGDKALDQEIAQNYRQAQMDFEAGKYNASQFSSYQDDLQRWAENEQKRSQTAIEQVNEGNTRINQSRTVRAQADSADQRANEVINRAEQDAQSLENEAVEIEKSGDTSTALKQLQQARQIRQRAQTEANQFNSNAQKFRADADKLESEGNSLFNQSKNSKPLPKPKMGKDISAPKLGKGKYSGKVFDSPESLKPAFPNKSAEEIRRIVESNGGKFSQ